MSAVQPLDSVALRAPLTHPLQIRQHGPHSLGGRVGVELDGAVVVDLPAREAGEGLLDRYAALQPGQGSAQAKMWPHSERDVLIRSPVDVEAVGVRVDALVAPSRAGQEQHL